MLVTAMAMSSRVVALHRREIKKWIPDITEDTRVVSIELLRHQESKAAFDG